MERVRVILALSALLVAITQPQTTFGKDDGCKVTLEWTLIDYTSGDVGSDSWRFRAKGIVNGATRGFIVVPPFSKDRAFLQPGGSFDPARVLVGPDAPVGAKGVPLHVFITAEASEFDEVSDAMGRVRVQGDFSRDPDFLATFTCVGTGLVDFPVTVNIADPGGEDIGGAGSKATLTYRFLLIWDP